MPPSAAAASQSPLPPPSRLVCNTPGPSDAKAMRRPQDHGKFFAFSAQFNCNGYKSPRWREIYHITHLVYCMFVSSSLSSSLFFFSCPPCSRGLFLFSSLPDAAVFRQGEPRHAAPEANAPKRFFLNSPFTVKCRTAVICKCIKPFKQYKYYTNKKYLKIC